jgi:cytochrome c553
MQPSRIRWNEYKVQKLIAMAARGETLSAIATVLNMTIAQVRHRARALQVEIHAHAKPTSSRSSTSALRQCLRCHHDFMSRNIDNRICPPCTKINASRSGALDVARLTQDGY